jgi:hypothetical protein
MVVALVATNGWWAWNWLDRSVSAMYREDVCRQREAALTQAVAVIESLGRLGNHRAKIIEAARRASPGSEPFEKDAEVLVDNLAFRFDARGALVAARSEPAY